MRLLLITALILLAYIPQTAFAKPELGKYQRLALQLDELCKNRTREEALVSAIRKSGGFRVIKGTRYVGKAGAVNFGRVRLKILESGEWDLVTEVPSGNLQFKTEHFAPHGDLQLFAFSNAKAIEPAALTKADRPTLIIFTPSKVIAVRADDKTYYILDRPDHNFAEVTYHLKSRLGI